MVPQQTPASQQPETTADAGPAEDEYAELQDTEWSDPSLPNTFPSGVTVEADLRDCAEPRVADAVGEPSDADGDGAPDHVAPSVAEAERAANERGANVRGEGQITGEPTADR